MKLGVPSLALSCLKTPKFMIYLSANRLRYSCFAIVINYSHCKRTLCFQAKKASIPRALLYVDFLCTKKKKSLNRIDWKFTEGRKRAEIGLLVPQIPDEKFLKHSSYLRKVPLQYK